MSSHSARLRAAHRIYLGRAGAPTAGDRWFSLYLMAFVSGWYVLPVAYVSGTFLEPEFAQSLTSAEASGYLACGLVLLGLVALWFGRVQGPAFLTPFLAQTLLSTDIPRHRVLLPPTLTALLGVSALICVLAAVAMFALSQAGAWGWDTLGELVLAAFLGGIILGLLALLGQRVPLRWMVTLSAASVLLSAAHLLLCGSLAYSPGGWFAVLWSAPAVEPISELWALLLLAAVALIGITAVATFPAVLGGIPAQRVLAQSRRVSEARLFTATGSINDAVELFRAKPRRRLSPRAVASEKRFLSGSILGLRQDVVTTLRNPLTVLNAVLLIPAGAALLTLAASTAGADFSDSDLIVTVPVGVVGGLLLFLGSGSLTEGWRQLKREFDAAALFGWSARSALGRRLLWPMTATAVLVALGTTPVVMLAHPDWAAAAWTAGLTLLGLAARFLQSMRPSDIPVELLAPTVIPGGIDLSAVKILVWLGDGIILLTTGVLAVVILPWEPRTLAAVLLALVLTGVLWGWARTGHRLFAAAPKART